MFEMLFDDECEANIGADDISSASRNVLSDTCEISTIMPRWCWTFASSTSPEEFRPIVGVGVREGHLADAQRVVVAQQAPSVLDAVPAFQAHQCGDLAALVNGFDVIRGQRQLEVAGKTADLLQLSSVSRDSGRFYSTGSITVLLFMPLTLTITFTLVPAGMPSGTRNFVTWSPV